jgi:hypothetical protein
MRYTGIWEEIIDEMGRIFGVSPLFKRKKKTHALTGL